MPRKRNLRSMRLVDRECSDARKLLPLEPFEEGAAGRRDIGELVLDTRCGERRDRIAAAGDRKQAPGLRQFRRLSRDPHGTGIEGRDLESAHRSIPEKSARLASLLLDQRWRTLPSL